MICRSDNHIYFEIPGRPIPKGRPRSYFNGKSLQIYTPRETRIYEKKVKYSFNTTYNQKFFDFPEEVNVLIIVHKKLSKYSKIKKVTGKPDLDNLAKSILDGLNGVAYKDDSQVCFLSIIKFLDSKDYVEVHIW
jgi:Holliday junction resolvase RusA-like endonuclease